MPKKEFFKAEILKADHLFALWFYRGYIRSSRDHDTLKEVDYNYLERLIDEKSQKLMEEV